MRLCSIASGSSGNCIYIGSDSTHILVDVGISGKRTEAGLKELELSMRDIDGIFITHEHTDHIAGLGVLSRKYEVPIYATRGTIEAIQKTSSVGKIPEDLFHTVFPDEKLMIKDICCNPMRISHDAADPVAYKIKNEEKTAAVVTDLGTYDENMIDKIKNLDVLLLEANHDVHMLQVGSYPYPLKQRILGKKGHLSNELSGQLLGEVLHDHFNTVILGHLSKENNYAELAYETVRLEVTMGENPYKGDDFPMYVAKRDAPSERIIF